MASSSRRIAGPRPPPPPSGSAARWALVGLGAIALLIAARSLLQRPASAPPARPELVSAPPVSAGRSKSAPPGSTDKPAAPSAEAPVGQLPASLRGTEEDGALRVDERGDLLVGPDVLAFFDYYLAASGEESEAAIKARINKRIREKVKDPAAAEASRLLDKYLAYRQATRSMKAGADGDLAGRLDELRRLRRSHFGAEDADKLFGVEERATAVAIAQQGVQKDPRLSPEEKKKKLEELEATLPEEVRAARQATLGPLRQREEEQAMRAAGATDEEIQRHRVETVGQEAADRLKDLDQQRALWKKRVADFQATREAITRSQPDPAARDAAIEKALDDAFSPEEKLRVKALLTIAEGAGK